MYPGDSGRIPKFPSSSFQPQKTEGGERGWEGKGGREEEKRERGEGGERGGKGKE